MSDAVWIALIVAIAPTLAAIGAFILSFRNTSKLDKLSIEVNHRLDALILAREDIAKAAGIIEGKASTTP